MSEAFDPFNVSDADDLFTATVAPTSAPVSPVKTRVPSFNIKPQYVAAQDRAPPIVVLPKMDVKLKMHEEVTSKAVSGMGEDGTVELFVEGKVMVSSLLLIRSIHVCIHITCASTQYSRMLLYISFQTGTS
jgi:hypothetical protein